MTLINRSWHIVNIPLATKKDNDAYQLHHHHYDIQCGWRNFVKSTSVS